MKKFVKIAKAILAISLATFIIVSCANPVTSATSEVTSSSKALSVSDPTPDNAASFALTAGQYNSAGNVYIWKDSENLYIKYVVSDSYNALLSAVHVEILNSLSGISSSNDLAPGQFSYKVILSPTAKTALVTVSLADFSFNADGSIYVLAHAALTDGETAWGGSIITAGKGKWYGTILVTPPTGVVTSDPVYYSISGSVYRDLNNNGAMDSGEEGLAGVTVTLSSGASATTDGNGAYSFSGLTAGSYTVSLGGLTGYYPTPYSAPITSETVSLPNSKSGINFGLSYETIAGITFYDVNKDGVYQSDEPVLGTVVLQLNSGSSTTSASDGTYSFDHLKGDTAYTVTAGDLEGFIHSGSASQTVTPAGGVAAQADFGYVLDYSWINGKTANGYTIGFWKTNLDKAISGKTKGIQVSATTLNAYASTLSNFQLAPLNVTSPQAASNYLSATGSSATLLLSKQLMGSEFNYASGAYIGGNQLLTYFFLYDGEYMLANPTSFSSAQLLAQKDKYDAYNNTEGGSNPIYF